MYLYMTILYFIILEAIIFYIQADSMRYYMLAVINMAIWRISYVIYDVLYIHLQNLTLCLKCLRLVMIIEFMEEMILVISFILDFVVGYCYLLEIIVAQ